MLSPILTLDSSKIQDDLVFLMGCLREVLEEAREPALAERLPWLGTAPTVTAHPTEAKRTIVLEHHERRSARHRAR